MKNFSVKVKQRGLELLVLTFSAEKEDGTKVERDVDLSGNMGQIPVWIANVVCGVFNDLNGD